MLAVRAVRGKKQSHAAATCVHARSLASERRTPSCSACCACCERDNRVTPLQYIRPPAVWLQGGHRDAVRAVRDVGRLDLHTPCPGRDSCS
eukprot:1151972-Pelagomonas_calceolata.AAC.3